MSSYKAKRQDSVQFREDLQPRVDNLRNQLQNFKVRDPDGEAIGHVRDLIMGDNGKLHLVVSGVENPDTPRLVLIRSDLIQKIEYATDSVFVIVSREQFDGLPEYYEEMVGRPAVDSSDVPRDWLSEPAANAGQTPPQAKEEWVRAQKRVRESPGAPESSTSAKTPLRDDRAKRQVSIEDDIQVLEERLQVDRSKRKVGEVVVRKEIETRVVEVPVRREKLIVEQVSPESKPLAEVDLGEGQVTGLDSAENGSSGGVTAKPTVSGEFTSVTIAAQILDAIASRQPESCSKVRLSLEVEDERLLETYQQWFERYSNG
ncbi:DUF2382 domain-containing protein [Phormidium sp. CCY1219]|uniref:DUF2382 domain-containing protein n=1 Tax=Phormidium sp. CCY1219 TaxID=2886104 RepID=UPI002D1F7BCB|nr:DUF2382 domain-containing protein [Phormidium sp. CCY1219]MEB3831640.1 YsnF/AvaK domain-containing protein [Phormidium sp. CCY1219]